jgi:hypothetical protein
MIKLFEGEKIVSQSEHRLVELTLTTHRIFYEYSVWGNSYNQNIGLEHITSCENKYASNIVFAIISVVSVIFGFIIGTEISIGIGFFLFVLFAIIYALTKQNNIIVGSPSTRMKIDVKGMKREKILEFIDLIEETKHKRISSLKN